MTKETAWSDAQVIKKVIFKIGEKIIFLIKL